MVHIHNGILLSHNNDEKGVPCGSAGEEFSCNVGDLGSIPGLGRSPGEGKGYPLQYSGLENSMDSSCGCKESDMTDRISLSFFFTFNDEKHIENRLMDMGRGKERVRCMERITWKHIIICKIDSQREFAVWLRKLKQALCINLEGWDEEGNGREVQKGGDMCILMADSC